MRTFLLTFIIFATFVPVAVFAQQNLVNLPIGDNGDFNDYINAVYLMFISIAALIAVIKIIIAGVKYMFSDIVTQKSDAKRDIQGALLGLLVVLSAVVVLSIINPDLATFDPQIEGIPGREGVTLGNENVETRNACLNSSSCVYQNCIDSCDEEIAACEDSGREVLENGPNSIGCVGTPVNTTDDAPFMSGQNFVSDLQLCESTSNNFYLVAQASGQNVPVCCSGSSCPNISQNTIGTATFENSTVYTEADRDNVIATIQSENGTAFVTTISSVSNDQPKLNEIENNLNQCIENNYTPYRLNYTDGFVVNTDIICIEN